MKNCVRWALCCGALTLAVGLVYAAEDTTKAAIDKLAEEGFKDPEAAKKAAAAAAKKIELEDLMSSYKPRMKGGFGHGAKAAAGTPANADGIESKLTNLGKKAPTANELTKDADGLLLTANRTAALAMLTLGKTPEKKAAGKDPKDWVKWSEDQFKGAQAMAEAVKAKNAKGVGEAAKSINAACNNCHGVFRD